MLGPHVRGLPGRSIRTYRYLFNSYYEAVGARQPRPRARPDHPADRGGGRPLPPARRRRHGRRCSTAASTGAVGDLVELGLHHEQQHQELLLMDIKHVLSQNPLAPGLPRDGTPSPTPGPPRPVTAPAAGSATPAAWSRSATTGRASPSTTKGRGTRRTAPAVRLADRLVTCGRLAGVHRRRRVPTGPTCGCRDGWAARPGRGLGRARCTGDQDPSGGWEVFTLTGPAPRRPGRARGPRQLLRGRRLRPLGRRPPAHRGGVGGRGAGPLGVRRRPG